MIPAAITAATAPLLCSVPPDSGQRRAAAAILAFSAAIFLVAAPFAQVQLPEIWAFLPIYQSAYVMVSLVTAVLLLGQFHLMRSRALLLLAGAYLFDALMATAHALSFPGLFAPGGLLGAGPQTTAWLYFLWHGGFPLLVAGYALLKGSQRDILLPASASRGVILAATGITVAAVGGLTLLTTAGHDLLPAIMTGNLDAATKIGVATLTWLLSLAALAVLWRRRPHTLLDLWLMVVICIWILDSALAAVLNHGRFDVGWYAGRVCGLFAGSLVLVMLLIEDNALYLRLAQQRDEELRNGGERLRDSEARFARLFHEAPVPLCFVNKDGLLVDRNRRFDQTFGYGHEELRSLADWWSLAYPDPDYRARTLAAWKTAVVNASRHGVDITPDEYRVACKDGSERVMLISGITLGEDFLVTLFDVTERSQLARAQTKQIEEQHQARIAALNQMEDANAARAGAEASARRLRRLAEVVERIAAVHDLATLMEVVRPAVRALTGADGATLVLNDNGYCHYADEDAIGPLWKGQRFPLESCISGWAMAHAQAVVIDDIYADARIPHDAYRPTFVKSLAMVPVGRDKPVAAIGCYWATRHKASVEELEMQQALADAMSIGLANIDLIQNLEQRVEERTAELTAANRELDAFAYAVSHDLRAPLRAMSGFAQALAEDHGHALAGEARAYLEQISIASRRMGELIDGLLVLSRITRGELRRDDVDISALATRCLDELGREEPARQVAVSIAPGLVARGDARMIEAALRNLLGNAWKYTGQAAAPAIRIHGEERNGRRWICVADNGAGFDMAHAERLFKPFQRLHRQDEFPGIGIGLATVQRIVHRHGGEIAASGEPGKGASFCFTLPEGSSKEASQ